jgi:hypothetical protein
MSVVSDLDWLSGNSLVLQNKDVMKSIRSSLYYYENVAHSPTDLERRTAIENSAAKLKDIVAHIEAELEGTQRTSQVNRFAETLFSDCDYG